MVGGGRGLQPQHHPLIQSMGMVNCRKYGTIFKTTLYLGFDKRIIFLSHVSLESISITKYSINKFTKMPGWTPSLSLIFYSPPPPPHTHTPHPIPRCTGLTPPPPLLRACCTLVPPGKGPGPATFFIIRHKQKTRKEAVAWLLSNI